MNKKNTKLILLLFLFQVMFLNYAQAFYYRCCDKSKTAAYSCEKDYSRIGTQENEESSEHSAMKKCICTQQIRQSSGKTEIRDELYDNDLSSNEIQKS